MTTIPTIAAIAPWFGSNRMNAERVGELLKGRAWVGIPFAGGLCEVPHIDARTVAVNDLHSHVINLARVTSDPVLGPRLYRLLKRAVFHPETLEAAQQEAGSVAAAGLVDVDNETRLAAAASYFVSQWMGRSGNAGKSREFAGQLPIRWTSSGGDSNTRYRSAVASLLDWRRVLARCNFTTLDAFEFLANCKDQSDHGIYCDPPFPDAGEEYLHNAGRTKSEQRAWHEKLAAAVGRFQSARVVMRFYDHPLVRDLYPETRWTWQRFTGRTQSNGKAEEVLLMNGPSLVVSGEGNLF